MKLGFARMPRPKRFNFPTRYYDPVKEERELRTRKQESEQYSSEKRIKGELSKKWRKEDDRQRDKRNVQSTVIYILVAAILIYIIFFAKLF